MKEECEECKRKVFLVRVWNDKPGERVRLCTNCLQDDFNLICHVPKLKIDIIKT